MNTPEETGWTQRTRDRWFYAYLVITSVLLVRLFWPYLMVLLFAAMTVVVCWPLYVRALALSRGQRAVAAVLTSGFLALVIFGPLTLLGYLFALEAVEVAGPAVKTVGELRVDELAEEIETTLEAYQDPRVTEFLNDTLPDDFDPVAAVLGPAKDALLNILNAAGSLVPQMINTIVNGSIDAAIFVAAVISLFMEGPKILAMMRNLSPMDDRYEARLFEVFREFSTNMAVGSVATAAAMGFVAGIGYAICGIDSVFFFAILTAVCSFVPIVGAMVIWVPLAILVFWQHGWGWGLFLTAWSVLFTGTVDNILKPFFLRGSSNIHPLLVFLAVFGGMAWLNLPGVLIGPTLVAFFLALYTIYVEDFLGDHAEDETAWNTLGADGSISINTPKPEETSSSNDVLRKTDGPVNPAPDAPEPPDPEGTSIPAPPDLAKMDATAQAISDAPRKRRTAYFGGWGGKNIPRIPTEPLEETAARARPAYYVATYDAQDRLVQFEKFLQGTPDWCDFYTYEADGSVSRTMRSSDPEPKKTPEDPAPEES